MSTTTLVLPATTRRAIAWQVLLLAAAAYLLPAVGHALRAPVSAWLPMHWPVLLAGLVYGWRSGLLIGLSAPLAAYLLSGMPAPPALAPMMVELAVYGAAAGFVRQQLAAPRIAAVAVALVLGRVAYMAAWAVAGREGMFSIAYMERAFGPAVMAMVMQAVLLPLVAAKMADSE